MDRACFLGNLRSADVDLDGFELSYGDDDNQGSDSVFLTVIGPDGNYVPVQKVRKEH